MRKRLASASRNGVTAAQSMQLVMFEKKIGFQSKMKKDAAEVLLYQLDKLDAGTIDVAALRAAKLIPASARKVKIVKKGEVTKKFVLQGLLATAGAKAAIEAAGGQVGE